MTQEEKKQSNKQGGKAEIKQTKPLASNLRDSKRYCIPKTRTGAMEKKHQRL